MPHQIKTKVSKQKYISKKDNSVKNCYFWKKTFHSFLYTHCEELSKCLKLPTESAKFPYIPSVVHNWIKICKFFLMVVAVV